MPKIKGMTAREIIAKCTPRVREAADYVQIIKTTPKVLKDGRHQITSVCRSTHTPNGNSKPKPPERHLVEVTTKVPGERIREGMVVVSCHCSNFAYTWEVALARKGASYVKHSNGDLPEERNPKMVPGACKHVYKTLLEAVRSRV